jgi:hypothetical protein
MPAPIVEIIPVAEWRPDMPDLAVATSIAQNVVPATPESYGPMPAFAEYGSSALDGACIGAICVQATDDSVHAFAGSTDKLYHMDAAAATWTDVSGSTYATATGDNWRFALFGASVVATNFGDAPQSFTLLSSSAFGALFTATAWAASHAYSTLGAYVLANGNRYTLTQAGTSASTGTGPSGTGSGITDGTCLWNYQAGPPPQAQHICTPKNFLMLGNTYDAVGGTNIQRVWWSAAGDATSFPSPGSDAAITGMSDYNDFEGNFGPITGLVSSLANADVAIFFERAVWRGLFVGPPDVFDFFPTENVRGCPAPNSIVPIGSLVWYLGTDGFYVFDGSSSTPIGVDKFDAWFQGLVNQNYLFNVVGAANIPNKMVFWAFPSKSSHGGVCDTILVYRWDIQRAAYISLGSAGVEWLMQTLTFGVSMDSMASLGFTDVDTLPASLDSAVWAGGAPILGGFDSSHIFGNFSGPNMAATVATETKQLTPGRRSYVQSSRPLVDLDVGVPSIAFAARVNLYDPEVFGAAVAPNAAGECPQRSDGRYHDAEVTIPAGAVWTHIAGVEATFIPGGTR